MNYKFSILCPTYNAEKYIERMINSVLSQKYKNFEIIFGDNYSTDNTLKIIEKYRKKFPKKIYLFKKKDEGVGDSLNNIFNKSKGEIINWLDSDDEMKPNTLAAVNKIFNKYQNFKFIYGNTDIINKFNKKVGEFRVEKFNRKRFLTKWHYIVFSSVYFKKNLFKKKFLNNLGNDLDFYLRANKLTNLEYYNRSFSRYRIHDKNISSKSNLKDKLTMKKRIFQDFVLVLKNYPLSLRNSRFKRFVNNLDNPFFIIIRLCLNYIFSCYKKFNFILLNKL